MTARLQHRGPDDDGLWVDAEAGLALGHRRLSIVDLSPEGHQPMASHGGRYVIAFNCELYNFRSLRSALVAQGHVFICGSLPLVLFSPFLVHFLSSPFYLLSVLFSLLFISFFFVFFFLFFFLSFFSFFFF